jgi:outer membrane protein assembly factor BamB
MRSKSWVKKGLVCGIILLFIGTSITPGIGGGRESNIIQSMASNKYFNQTKGGTPSEESKLVDSALFGKESNNYFESKAGERSYDWPMFHHDLEHTGYSTSMAPNTSNVLWNRSIGYSIESSPAVVDGKVYIAQATFPGKISCLDASNGASIWNYTVAGSIGYSSPAVFEGKVYIGSVSRLYCLDALTGNHIWNHSGISSQENSPTVAYGNVYIGSTYDSKVYCLNAITGNHVWNYTTGGWIELSSPAVWDGKVYIGSRDGKIYCLNAYTGIHLWNYSTASVIFSSPAVANGRVYVGSYDNNLYCLDATNGNLLWTYNVGNTIFSSPSIAYGKVYFGGKDGIVYCINASNGSNIWSYSTGNTIHSSPAIADEKVYIGSYDNKVYCFDANTGAKIWNYTTGMYVISSPAIVNGKVYIGSESMMYCFGSKNAGNWSIETVDSNGDVGWDTSIVVDSNNHPNIGYVDDYNSDLKYAKWSGTSWSIQTVDSGFVLPDCSLALDSNNQPNMCYVTGNFELKYAKWANTSWSIETIDTIGANGGWVSLTIDSNDNPHISYLVDSSVGDLKYATKSGISWIKETVDSVGHVGAYSSIAVDSNNKPHISYYDATNHRLKYANKTGSAWLKEVVDSDGDPGAFTSIALDSNNNPYISYFVFGSLDLRFAKKTASSWIKETIDSTGDVGRDTSLVVDSYNQPHISYYDNTNSDLKYAKMEEGSWIIETVDAEGSVGQFTSIALDTNNNPHISYYDATNFDLKSAKYIGGEGQSLDWWSMFRHDSSHSGYSTSIAPQTNTTVWNFTTGGYVESSPTVSNGKVYIGSWDGKLYCLDADTGAWVWDYTTGSRVESSPAITNGKVYVGSYDGKIYCLNAYTGAWIWDYTTGIEMTSSPTVTNGKVYIGLWDGTFYCLDADTGAWVWDYMTGIRITSSPAVANGKVYIGSWDGTLYCLDADTGEWIWDYSTGYAIESSPTVSNGKVYIGSWDGKLYCLDADTGEWIWDYTTDIGITSSPAVANGKVYIGSWDWKVYCLDADTGEWIWDHTTTGSISISPAVADEKVYIGSGEDKVYCLDAITGAKIWEFTKGIYLSREGPSWSSPAIANGKVYVGSEFEGKVYCFGGGNGGSWSCETVDSIEQVGRFTSLALDSNNQPHISYYDDTNGDLKYAKWTGAEWSITTVDSIGDVGKYTSIALDSNNWPHISYYDVSNGDLMYVRWDGSSWQKETVDSIDDVGEYSSIELDSNNWPHISYYDVSNGDLMYVRWDGSSWLKETVDSIGDVGYFTSIALDSNNWPHISYYDDTDTNLMYAKWTGIVWLKGIVDYVGDIGGGQYEALLDCLALDSNDQPHIAYHDWINRDLKYAKWTGSSWDTEIVDSSGLAGMYPSIALDSNDKPSISYYEGDNNILRHAWWDGSAWYNETVDSAGAVGHFTSIALDSNNRPHISYYDTANGDLKYAKYIGGVNQPPNIPGTPTGPTSLIIGQSGSFSSSATDPDGDQVQYRFDWDAAGSHSYSSWTSLVPSGQPVSVSHSWGLAGTYVVKVQAQDEHLSQSSWSNGLSVTVSGANQPPVADFTWTPINPTTGQTITFNAGGSYDPDGYLTLYEWDWNNDGVYEESHSWSTTTHSWPQGGNYQIRLRVTDNSGSKNTAIKTVNVNKPPIANAGGPYSGYIGNLIIFDGSNSYDLDGNIIGYRWDFTNDGLWDTGWLSSPTRSYTYYSQFHGNIKLEVKDNLGATITDTANIDVNKPNQPPVAIFSWSPSSPQQGQTITFDASASYDPDGFITLYEWDWDNNGVYDESHTYATATHQWSNPNTYVINLRITDNAGSKTVKTRSVTVSSSGPPPFNPPAWVSKLMSITGVHETWKGDYWYVNIPFNYGYVPPMDFSANSNVLWPFGGMYNTALRQFNSNIQVKIYPNNPGKNSYVANGINGDIIITLPFADDNAQIIFHSDLRDSTWDVGDVSVAADFTIASVDVTLNGWVWIIPVTAKLEISFSGGPKASCNNPCNWQYSGGIYTNVWLPQISFSITATFKGGVGFDYGGPLRVSLGFYGSIGGEFTVPPPNVEFSGEVGVYGEIGWWEVRAKLWPKSYFFNNITWQQIPREYGEPQWQDVNRGVLIKEVFPFAQPSVASRNDKKMMVWVYDNKSKEQINGYDLNYSIWNGSTWSNPKSITNDNYNEMYPDVVLFDNGDAICVFTIVQKENITSLDEYLMYSKIAYSYYNHTADEWSQVNLLYDTPEPADFQPVISSDGNNAVAAWTCDKDNNIFTINDTVTYVSFWDTNTWSNTRIISNKSIASYPLSLDYENGTAVIAYTADMDGNITTKNDREIYGTTLTPTQILSTTRLTNDSSMDSSPSVKFSDSIPYIVWIKETNNHTTLYYKNLNNQTQIPIIDGNISNPQLFFGGVNNDEPIIGWKDYSIEGLFSTRFADNQWKTKGISDSNKTINQYSWDYTNAQFTATYIEKDNVSSKKNCNLISIYNVKPDDPSPPDGPLNGYNNTEYEYSCVTIDNDSDELFYLFDWGDDTSGNWIGPFNSSQTIYASHNWTNPGVYDIRVKAKDVFGLETIWSNYLTIEINGSTDAPDFPFDPYPFDNASDVPFAINLSCIVTDLNDNPLDVTFLWGTGENKLGWNYSYNISSGRRAELSLNSLGSNTTYWWYVEVWNGEYKTKSKTWSFTTILDDTPPITIISFNGTIGNSSWYISPVDVSLNAIDSQSGVVSTKYKLDDDSWMNYTGPFIITDDGEHTISYYSIDGVDNEETLKSANLNIDTIIPFTTHTLSGSVGNNDWYTNNVTVALISTDTGSGVNHTFYKLDDGDWSPYTTSFIVSTDGVHTLKYYSVDFAGNTESVKGPFSFKIDTIKPVTTHVFTGMIGNNSWYISDVTITLTATDTSSGINNTYYQVDNNSWNTFSTPFIVSDDGSHNLKYYSVDNAGNTETVKGPFIFKIDKTIPVTTHSFSATMGNNNWYISNVSIILTATDHGLLKTGLMLTLNTGKGPLEINHTYYKIDNGNWVEYSTPATVSADGLHNLSYYSVDLAGNTEPVKGPFLFKIDQTPPTITLAKEQIDILDVKFTADVSDETSGIDRVEFSLDGMLQYNDTQSPYEWTWTGIGNHQMTATAYDKAGNSQNQSMSTPVDQIQGMKSGFLQMKQQLIELVLKKQLLF